MSISAIFHRALFLAAATAATLTLSANVGRADNCSLSGTVSTWTHGGSGNWGSGTNWSGGGSPNSGSRSVCITDGTSTVTLDQTATVKDLQLNLGNALDIAGSYTLNVAGSQIVNGGAINIQANSASAALTLKHDVSLSGGGQIDLNSTGAGIAKLNGHFTLTNVDNTIQGSGLLTGGLNLVNQASGVVDANLSGKTLSLAGMAGVVNAGLIEATNGGILQLKTTVSNTGLIEANGGTVKLLTGAEIDGGTLKSINGGAIKAGAGQGVTLNGVTIASGTTYFGAGGSSTHLEGTIINNGAIALQLGTSGNTIIQLDSDVTLTGGGTVRLASGNNGSSFIRSASPGFTLTNLDNTIKGAGTIGNGFAALINDGTIQANVSGRSLTINASGIITNNGIFEADAGAILHVSIGQFTNFASNTLTGGTYEISSGTMQIDQLGTKGGEIVNNDASIILDGSSSSLLDKKGYDALSKFANNEAGGSFTVSGGRAFTGANTFTNQGQVTIGQDSSLTAATAYNQVGSAAITQIDGTLHSAVVTNNAGGTIQGTGTIVGNLFNYGTLKPGDSPGTLTIDGNFTQGATGTLSIDIAGTGAGQYDQLKVTGAADLAGTLALNILNGFTLAAGQTFDILRTGSDPGDFSFFVLNGIGCTAGANDTWFCGNLDGLYFAEVFLDDGLQLNVLQRDQDLPEPASIALIGTGLFAAGALRWRRRKAARSIQCRLMGKNASVSVPAF